MSAPAKNDAGTSCKQAIDKWRAQTNEDPATAKVVKLLAQFPPIKKMDAKLNELSGCEHLSLSSNAIDRIIPLPGLKNLKILSVGRNNLKRFEKLEDLGNSLEQLWVSYNGIEKLDGLGGVRKLKVLFMSNNMIKSFDELLKLRELPALEELLLVGNPIYEGLTVEQRRIEVVRRLPKLKKLDAIVVSETEREIAMGGAAAPAAAAPAPQQSPPAAEPSSE